MRGNYFKVNHTVMSLLTRCIFGTLSMNWISSVLYCTGIGKIVSGLLDIQSVIVVQFVTGKTGNNDGDME